jgi:transcriptional regulator with XRE-family HTH domain
MLDEHTRTALRYVAGNVRKLRRRAGLTQEQLSERTGFELRFFQRVEHGAVNLSIDSLVRLARALDVQPAALLRRTTLPPSRPGRPRQTSKRAIKQ